VETLFPEKMGDEKEAEFQLDISAIKKTYPKQIAIKSPENGYLQYVDSERLIEIVAKNDALLELYCRPGKHLVKGMEIGMLHAADDEILEQLVNQLIIGKTKTSQQDLEYSIHQMVEIAARALSPGVNDPFTATACIDNLTATMCYLAQVKFPSKYRLDDQGKLRVITDAINFEGLLDAAFNQIRQYSGGTASVIIRLMEALITIFEFTKKESHQKAVLKHAEMVWNIGKETIKEKNDIEDLSKRKEIILK
jgi:uncharacterized membrane protein